MKIFNLVLIFVFCTIISVSHQKIKKNQVKVSGKSVQKRISKSEIEKILNDPTKTNGTKIASIDTKNESKNAKKIVAKSKGKNKKPIGKNLLKDKKHIHKSRINQGKSRKKMQSKKIKSRTTKMLKQENQESKNVEQRNLVSKENVESKEPESESKKLHQPKKRQPSKLKSKKIISKSKQKYKSTKNITKSNLRSKLSIQPKFQEIIITESLLLPSLASITYIGIHICSGTVLTDRFILTVAHCVYDGLHEILPKENMKVILGKTSTENGTFYDVQGLVTHENYDNVTYANDIALIRTLNPIIFGKNVIPMVLREKEVLDNNFKDNATVSWFGFNPSTTNAMDENFVIANVHSIPIDVCKNTFVGVSLRHICMSSVATHGHCNEDSGGPLVIGSFGKMEQIGILSFSINCGINKPEVYTRISWYFEWIKKVIERIK